MAGSHTLWHSTYLSAGGVDEEVSDLSDDVGERHVRQKSGLQKKTKLQSLF